MITQWHLSTPHSHISSNHYHPPATSPASATLKLYFVLGGRAACQCCAGWSGRLCHAHLALRGQSWNILMSLRYALFDKALWRNLRRCFRLRLHCGQLQDLLSEVAANWYSVSGRLRLSCACDADPCLGEILWTFGGFDTFLVNLFWPAAGEPATHPCHYCAVSTTHPPRPRCHFHCDWTFFQTPATMMRYERLRWLACEISNGWCGSDVPVAWVFAWTRPNCLGSAARLSTVLYLFCGKLPRSPSFWKVAHPDLLNSTSYRPSHCWDRRPCHDVPDTLGASGVFAPLCLSSVAELWPVSLNWENFDFLPRAFLIANVGYIKSDL